MKKYHTSSKSIAVSRRNGKLGGRPKKIVKIIDPREAINEIQNKFNQILPFVMDVGFNQITASSKGYSITIKKL